MAKINIRGVDDIPNFFDSSVYLGIDLSYTATGLALVALDGRVFAGSLAAPSDLKGVERLTWFYDFFYELFKYPWRQACIEGYSFASKFSQPHKLGEQGGAVRMAAYQRNVPTILLPPKNLKVFIGNVGDLKKASVIKCVLEKWGIETQNDNEADAVGLAFAARAYYQKSYGSDRELEALASAVLLTDQPTSKSRARNRK